MGKRVSKKGNGRVKSDSPDLSECLDCVCYEIRKTARFVINYYDMALKDVGLKSNQFIVLAAIAYLKSPNLTKLAEFVGIDQSTLARNLVTIGKQKLVSVRRGTNRREKVISLSRKGEQLLEKSFPLWKKAQERLVGGIGAWRWSKIQNDLHDVLGITKGLS